MIYIFTTSTLHAAAHHSTGSKVQALNLVVVTLRQAKQEDHEN